MRTMYDGIDSDAGVIATDAQLVAGYVDGDYAWTAADWARFPHSVKVRIAVRSTTDAGHVLDVETGDATPAESVGWVLTRRRAGADPTIYCNQQNPSTGWPAVRAAFQARGVPEPHYWVANYDGAAVLPPGAVAKQYASMARWDLSVVADYWPGVDPVPTTPAAPAASLEEDDMSLTADQNGRIGISVTAGSKHIVQATCDPRDIPAPAAGQPRQVVLRGVLLLEKTPATPGPYVFALTIDDGGSGEYRIPTTLIPHVRGIVLTGGPASAYDAIAV